MNPQSCSISACKHCRCFRSEGRRGGVCGRFETFAAGDWASCPFALPIFDEGNWETATDLIHLEKSFSLELAAENTSQQATQKQQAYSEIKPN